MSITPKSSVNVAESRLNPALYTALAEIKESVKKDGFFSISEYLECRDRHGLVDGALLPALQQAGYGFVKTKSVNPDLAQEVIVDLRFMAACMLLMYSDPLYAYNLSVLKGLDLFYRTVNWGDTLSVNLLGTLIADTYSTYGHHFSHMAIADAAVILEETGETVKHTQAFAERHKFALNELLKHEDELTAVYHLCTNVMFLANNHQVTKLPNFYRDHQPPAAYGYFRKAALKILDRVRAVNKTVQKPNCSDPQCNHQH